VLVEREDGSGHAECFAPTQIRHSRESGNPASPSYLRVSVPRPDLTPLETDEQKEKKLDPRLRGGDVGCVIGCVMEVRITGVEADTLIGVPA
jgi:hypothetical protein